ncbi:hypothetical protein QN277_023569 [Acacia crassicarpa]|uniref:Uncharacterized protein n=1 Tax=Acacia crassicarpa TaxID=499986 RepID=A0AAE1JHI6_9FABA|nr:hypothetical protein QN277_023569 [Acacia crassicarpa]
MFEASAAQLFSDRLTVHILANGALLHSGMKVSMENTLYRCGSIIRESKRNYSFRYRKPNWQTTIFIQEGFIEL